MGNKLIPITELLKLVLDGAPKEWAVHNLQEEIVQNGSRSDSKLNVITERSKLGLDGALKKCSEFNLKII